MKRVFVLVLVASLALTLSLATVSNASASPAGRSFTGAWWSIDVDGSHQKLVIAPKWWQPGAYSVYYYDDGATACGCDPENHPLYAAFAYGTGSASGTTLSGRLAVWCLSRPPRYLATFNFGYEYHPENDTLTDPWCVWHRIGTG